MQEGARGSRRLRRRLGVQEGRFTSEQCAGSCVVGWAGHSASVHITSVGGRAGRLVCGHVGKFVVRWTGESVGGRICRWAGGLVDLQVGGLVC